MALTSRIEDILGAALHMIDASTDKRKNSLAVKKLRGNMLRAMISLSVPKIHLIADRRATGKQEANSV